MLLTAAVPVRCISSLGRLPYQWPPAAARRFTARRLPGGCGVPPPPSQAASQAFDAVGAALLGVCEDISAAAMAAKYAYLHRVPNSLLWVPILPGVAPPASMWTVHCDDIMGWSPGEQAIPAVAAHFDSSATEALHPVCGV